MRTAALALIAALAASPASAQLIATGATCRNIWDPSRILAHKQDGAMLRLCTFKNGRVESAKVFEAPRKTAANVCVVTSEDVEIRRRRNGSYYQHSEDPTTNDQRMMPAGSGPCPRADDERYLWAKGTPDGVFLALLEMWKTMHETPSSFDGFLAMKDERDRSGAVRRDLSDPAVSARLVLTGIFAQGDSFKLIIHDKADWYEWTELDVDWTPEGWRIVGIDFPAI